MWIVGYALSLDWTRMIATVQLDAMLVQYAKHRASASETAGPPYFINGMTCHVQVDDSLLFAEKLSNRIPICQLYCTQEPSAAAVMKEYIDKYLTI